ncbi:hypothetical protein VD659_09385 [Herbiconiux sp. 11R-BC]|uniref:hypothetical protein n=1 Tax=Herbiconiux sp. 11R-BC TaxID=3111637 RepID=UPI003C0A863B
MIGLGLEPGAEECSRAGCREGATWRIEWRNPKIHSEERRKVWLACDEHVDYLREFLGARDFPVQVAPLAAAGAVEA